MYRAVFDTNILIDFSKDDPRALEALHSCEERLISIVTWVEFLTGVPDHKMEQAKQILSDMFEILSLDHSDYETVLDIRRATHMKLPDCIIYATAQLNDAVLITRNTKDFNTSMDGVVVPY